MNPHTSKRVNDEREKIDLHFSCRHIDLNQSKFHKEHIITLKKHVNGENWLPIGRTEVSKNNPKPDFAKFFELEFFFETKQTYKAELINVEHQNDESGIVLGEVVFDIAEILGSLNNLRVYNLLDPVGNKGGKLIAWADKGSKLPKKLISFNISVVHVPKFRMFSSQNSFLKFFKQTPKTGFQKSNNHDLSMSYDPEWLLISSTTNLKGAQVSFGAFSFKSWKLCGGDLNQVFKIELWKHKSNAAHYLMGKVILSVSQLESQSRFTFDLVEPQSVATDIIISNYKIQDDYDFTDYLRGNLSIGLTVGIDFTGSNGPSIDPSSLHHFKKDHLNLYQQAILSVGEILEFYNHARIIPTFGFGAEIDSNKEVDHCFPLSLDYNRIHFSRFGELFAAYESILNKIVFSGPTFFAPLIQTAIELTRQRFSADPYNYSVLLILTDGLINDLQATIDQIVEASFWPMSIIIIGIGDANFNSMDMLDADVNPLVDSRGRSMNRDIVQFVPFKKFFNQPFVLRQEVLFELPAQVVKYYSMNHIKPREPNSINLNDTALSYINKQSLNPNAPGGPHYPTLDEIMAKSKI
jgi:hypothetical protein